MNILLISLEHPETLKKIHLLKDGFEIQARLREHHGQKWLGGRRAEQSEVRKDSCKRVRVDITGPLLSGIYSSDPCLSETSTNLSQSTFQQGSGRGP